MERVRALKVYITVILILLTFINCDNINTKKIFVTGKITDSLTNQAICKAKVTVLCWYDAGWDKTDYESIDLITKEDGSFEVKFDEGYKITIASIAKHYDYKIKEIDSIESSNVEVELKLKDNNSMRDISSIDLRKIIINKTSN